MAVAGMQWSSMWVRHFGGTHTHSITVQVHNRDVVADVSLVSNWAAGSEHHAAIGGISQIVSNAGVENFSVTEYSVVPTIFRQNVTSVTFKVKVYKAHSWARLMIYDWV